MRLGDGMESPQLSGNARNGRRFDFRFDDDAEEAVRGESEPPKSAASGNRAIPTKSWGSLRSSIVKGR